MLRKRTVYVAVLQEVDVKIVRVVKTAFTVIGKEGSSLEGSGFV